MQISKESRPEKGEAPAIRDTRRGFFRAANCGGGRWGRGTMDKTWVRHVVLASQLFVIDTGERP